MSCCIASFLFICSHQSSFIKSVKRCSGFTCVVLQHSGLSVSERSEPHHVVAINLLVWIFKCGRGVCQQMPYPLSVYQHFELVNISERLQSDSWWAVRELYVYFVLLAFKLGAALNTHIVFCHAMLRPVQCASWKVNNLKYSLSPQVDTLH